MLAWVSGAPTGCSVQRAVLYEHTLLMLPLASRPCHAAGAAKRELGVEFRGLGLRLHALGGKTVLQGVTGALRASHVTAIMGPSGAAAVAAARAEWVATCPQHAWRHVDSAAVPSLRVQARAKRAFCPHSPARRRPMAK